MYHQHKPREGHIMPENVETTESAAEDAEAEALLADAARSGDTDESESQEDADTDDQDAEEAAAFDADRALKKIRKANSEAKTQRERAKSAEEKAKGLEPAKREAAEQRVARKLGLDDNEETDYFLSRLQGETADELAQDAERLLSLMAPKKGESHERKPKEALRGGGQPDQDPPIDNKKLAEDILSSGL